VHLVFPAKGAEEIREALESAQRFLLGPVLREGIAEGEVGSMGRLVK
jgi:hypothetical protein